MEPVVVRAQMWGRVLVTAETRRDTQTDTWLPGSPTCIHACGSDLQSNLPSVVFVPHGIPNLSLEDIFFLNSVFSSFHLFPSSTQCRLCLPDPFSCVTLVLSKLLSLWKKKTWMEGCVKWLITFFSRHTRAAALPDLQWI